MIIETLLDLDLYKLTMGQLAFERFPDVKVRYAFNNRSTQFPLAENIDENQLRSEIDHIQTLKLTKEEGRYLKSLGLFSDEYIEFLKNFDMSEVTIKITEDDQFEIETEDYWKNAILWETLILSVVNELYYKSKFQDQARLISYGTERNMAKLSFFSRNPEIPFTDFGTRRRFSTQWQDDVVSIMKHLPNFKGTSNVKLAMKYNLEPIGTNAHELYMIATGMWNEDLKSAHNHILDEWYDMYGKDLSIALSDTFGSKYFFEDFGEERARLWKGIRHDSGDPFEFGETLIKYYEDLGIDPKTKMVVFSDGLDMDKIERLFKQFNGRIKLSFGWGTHLTNDMGVETLSIVMKAVEVISVGDVIMNNHLVKLSDNLNKAMGPKDQVERFKEVFGYENTNRERTIV